MASGSNLAYSSTQENSSILDPSPTSFPINSSEIIYDPNTHLPSCLFVPMDSPSSFVCRTNIKSFPTKHWSIDALNRQIKNLLQYKLTHHMIRGKPFQTIQYHRQYILQEIGEWFQVIEGHFEKKDDHRQEDLLTLLASAHKSFKEIPRDGSEWTRLLTQWLKQNVSENVIKERTIYRLLSVDGFFGYEPKNLKQYLVNVIHPVRLYYRLHFRAVRILYEWFDQNESVSSLTGTDSACIVFLALLNLYSVHLHHLLNDGQVKLQVDDKRRRAEGFLNQHGDYYKDIRNVDDELLDCLGRMYQDQFSSPDEWKIVAKELLVK